MNGPGKYDREWRRTMRHPSFESRPSAEFIEHVRLLLENEPEAKTDEISAHFGYAKNVAVGWALAELAAIEDAERLPGSPFGKQLRQALKDAPDFESARIEPVLPPMQVVEAPALAFWREAYLAALGALLDPTLHFSDAGNGISVVAAAIADRAAMHFEELRIKRFAELLKGARQLADFRTEPRQ